MPIAISCPECSARIRVADESAGKSVRCPKCQTRMEVPQPESAADDEQEEERPAKVRKKKRRKKTTGSGSTRLLIGGLAVVALIGVCFVVFWFGLRKKPTAEVAANPNATSSTAPSATNTDAKENSAKPSPGPKRQNWLFNTAYEDKLGPYQTVSGLEIRLPKHYTRVEKKPNAPASDPEGKYKNPEVFEWLNADGKAGIVSSFQIELDPRFPNAEEQVLRNSITSQIRNMNLFGQKKYEATTPHEGALDGLPFLQAYWTEVTPGVQEPMRGFIYVGKHTNYLISITSHNVPSADNDFEITNAAATTLRLKTK